MGTKVWHTLSQANGHCSIRPDSPGPGSTHCYVHAEIYSVFLLGLSLDDMSQAPLAVWPHDWALAKRLWAEMPCTVSRHSSWEVLTLLDLGQQGWQRYKDPQEGRASRGKTPGSLKAKMQGHTSKSLRIRIWREQELNAELCSPHRI